MYNMKVMEVSHVRYETVAQLNTEVDFYKVDCSTTVYRFVKESGMFPHMAVKEFFNVIYVNQANVILGYERISEGGIASTVVDLRLVLGGALRSLAAGIILVHNHPSCTLRPSNHDIHLTRRIKEGAELLDLKVLDHLIVTPNDKYYSFADEGML
ncbi:MAG: JAB domain-containing protein [Oceanicaulis sp.]|nr:JAB domain-containing protein [Oceanicaulis sp.]